MAEQPKIHILESHREKGSEREREQRTHPPLRSPTYHSSILPLNGTRIYFERMSFEQRHRRQLSSATDTVVKDAKEDGKTEDFDKAIIHIQRKLDQIPQQYKKSSSEFNPLEQVIDMMKSTNLKERKKDLDINVRTLDKAMESIVKCTYYCL